MICCSGVFPNCHPPDRWTTVSRQCDLHDAALVVVQVAGGGFKVVEVPDLHKAHGPREVVFPTVYEPVLLGIPDGCVERRAWVPVGVGMHRILVAGCGASTYLLDERIVKPLPIGGLLLPRTWP